jgi:hypothetical protein
MGSLIGSVVAGISRPALIDVVREAVFAFSDGRLPGLPLGYFPTQSNVTLSTSVSAILGSGGGIGAGVRAGAFDSAFINSTDGTGLIYGCGFNSNNFSRLIAFSGYCGNTQYDFGRRLLDRDGAGGLLALPRRCTTALRTCSS